MIRDRRLIDQKDLQMVLDACDVAFSFKASDPESFMKLWNLIQRYYAMNDEIRALRSDLKDAEKSREKWMRASRRSTEPLTDEMEAPNGSSSDGNLGSELGDADPNGTDGV